MLVIELSTIRQGRNKPDPTSLLSEWSGLSQ
jgi:hypothetical protein